VEPLGVREHLLPSGSGSRTPSDLSRRKRVGVAASSHRHDDPPPRSDPDTVIEDNVRSLQYALAMKGSRSGLMIGFNCVERLTILQTQEGRSRELQGDHGCGGNAPVIGNAVLG